MDLFENHAQSLESPATRIAQIVPSDTDSLPFATRAIAVDTAGYLEVVTSAGDSGRLFIAAGAPFPVRVIRVLATGTTATGIVGLA